jgi:hypothetical protein
MLALRPMAKSLFMLTATPSSIIASAPPNPAVAGFGADKSFNLPSTPTFAQAYSIAKGSQPQTASKPSMSPRARSKGTQANSESANATPQAPKDSTSQKDTTPAAPSALSTAPVTLQTVPAPNATQTIATLLSAFSGSGSDDGNPILPPSSSTKQLASLDAAHSEAKNPDTATIPATTDLEAGLTAQAPGENSEQELNPQSALNPNADGATSQLDPITAESLPAGHSTQAAITAPSLAHASSSTQTPAVPDTPAPAAQTAGASVRNLQLLANSAAAAAAPAERIEIPLPNAATLVAATGESAPVIKSGDNNRQLIAQSIQPGLPTLASPAQTGAIQSIQSAHSSSGNSTGQNSGGCSGQPDSHSSVSAAAQSCAQTHSSDNTKSANGTDTSQSASKQTTATIPGAPQTASAVATPSIASANTAASMSQSMHAAAQAATLPDASAPAKTAQDVATSSPQSPAPSLPSLPRSLNDVSQATQLYQRVGGAEMHIAMDTDLLGLIDLRAVVHQGTLSATIGVQRADVQTLLVNELPALQHSLAEKNLQVGQISVLAGSVGNGTNANSQPRDQQNRQGPTAPAAPVFRDDAPSFISRAHMGEAAALTGNSARLSVLA